MNKIFRDKKGFTMIELMIVAVIVAILAVVVTSLLIGSKARAYSTEAETAMGSIRESLRLYYAENNNYPNIPSETSVESISWVNSDDLLGTFFDGPNYSIISSSATGDYTIFCRWNITTGDAPRENDVNRYDFVTTMDQDGEIVRSGY